MLFLQKYFYNFFLTFENRSLKLETVSLFQHTKIKTGCLTYASNLNIIFCRTLDSSPNEVHNISNIPRNYYKSSKLEFDINIYPTASPHLESDSLSWVGMHF